MAEGRTPYPIAQGEWYVEQPEVTEFLLAREAITTPLVLDPACGFGHVLKACATYYPRLMLLGSDLQDRRIPTGGWRPNFHIAEWPRHVEFYTQDFLTGFNGPGLDPVTIICNPPYGKGKLAEAFARKALSLPFVLKVALVVNAKFLWSRTRAEGLFRDHPPSRVYPIYPRPSMPPGEYLLADGKPTGGVENFCWIVWNKVGPHMGSVIRWGA